MMLYLYIGLVTLGYMIITSMILYFTGKTIDDSEIIFILFWPIVLLILPLLLPFLLPIYISGKLLETKKRRIELKYKVKNLEDSLRIHHDLLKEMYRDLYSLLVKVDAGKGHKKLAKKLLDKEYKIYGVTLTKENTNGKF